MRRHGLRVWHKYGVLGRRHNGFGRRHNGFGRRIHRRISYVPQRLLETEAVPACARELCSHWLHLRFGAHLAGISYVPVCWQGT
jgi:hypothetical protein